MARVSSLVFMITVHGHEMRIRRRMCPVCPLCPFFTPHIKAFLFSFYFTFYLLFCWKKGVRNAESAAQYAFIHFVLG